MNEPRQGRRGWRAARRGQMAAALAWLTASGLAAAAPPEAAKDAKPAKDARPAKDAKPAKDARPAPKDARPAPKDKAPLTPPPKNPADPLASPAGAADPLAVLREADRTWIYEMLQGASLDKLVRPPNTREPPRVRCKVVAWAVPAPLAGSRIECELLGAPDGPEGPTWSKYLVFDGAGVREVDDEHDLADRSRTGGLTFPRALDGRWKLDEKGAGGRRTQVIVREETAPVRGAPQKLWVAETTKWPAASAAPRGPDLELIRFVPGTGPVLLCTRTALGEDYHCLRLVEDKPPAQPGQPERVSISAHKGHEPSSLRSAEVAGKISAAPAVRRCYQAALAKRPGMRATLTLDFTVNAIGKVEALSVTGSDAGLAACVKAPVAALRFPIPMSAYAEPRVARFTIGLVLSPPAP